MKIFIDDGEIRFLLEESISIELEHMHVNSWPQNKVIIITLEKELENQIDKIKDIRKIARKVLEGFKNRDYALRCIISIKYDDLKKVRL